MDWSIQDRHFKNTTGFFDQERLLIVRSVISKCIPCQRLRQDIRQPLMGDLPRDHLPKNISPIRDNRSWLSWAFSRKEPAKPWKTLHTAFHMNRNSCRAHWSYREFVNRRYTFSNTTIHQPPRRLEIIRSDNGTNFIGANNTLKPEFEKLKNKPSVLQGRLLHKGITWVFKPPSAPHFRAAWERLIRVLKRYILQNRRDMTAAAYIRNFDCRDRNYNEQQTPDNGRLFRPPWWRTFDAKSFLTGKTDKHYAFCNLRDTNLNHGQNCKWRVLQQLVNNFWERFMRECLPNLTTRSIWTKPCSNSEVGDLAWLL